MRIWMRYAQAAQLRPSEEPGDAPPAVLSAQDLAAARLNAAPETIFVDSPGQLVGDGYTGARSYADWAIILNAQLGAAA